MLQRRLFSASFLTRLRRQNRCSIVFRSEKQARVIAAIAPTIPYDQYRDRGIADKNRVFLDIGTEYKEAKQVLFPGSVIEAGTHI